MTDSAGGEIAEERWEQDAWARYFARSVDVLLISVPMVILVSVGAYFLAEYIGYGDAYAELSLTPYFDRLTGWAAAILAGLLTEPLLISIFGGTPGKALMGVAVRDRDGRRISFPKSVQRWAFCLFAGRGMGIPLISLYTYVKSFDQVKTHGFAIWDDELDIVVTRHRVGWWRWAIGLLGIIITLGLAMAEILIRILGPALQNRG